MNPRHIGGLALLLGGCLAPDRTPRESMSGSGEQTTSAEDGGDDSGIDADMVLEVARNYEAELVKVNATPLPGTHGDAVDVNYYVAPEAEQLFRTIDPELMSQRVEFDEGAMFVKEHLDMSGVVVGFTVMRKARPGYDPDNGDWWWARVAGDDVSHQGKVDFCIACHVMVEDTDFVYGVPIDNRS